MRDVNSPAFKQPTPLLSFPMMIIQAIGRGEGSLTVEGLAESGGFGGSRSRAGKGLGEPAGSWGFG